MKWSHKTRGKQCAVIDCYSVELGITVPSAIRYTVKFPKKSAKESTLVQPDKAIR